MNELDETTVSANDIVKIAKKIEETQNDDTPVAIIDQDSQDITIVGDPNKTEKKEPKSYIVRFRLPADKYEKPEKAQVLTSVYIVDVKYDNIDITPRNDVKIVNSILKVKPFFEKLSESGETESRTNEEIIEMFAKVGDEVMLALYNLVATFLGIDDEMGQWMMPFSVIHVLEEIIVEHPEIFNEADYFFV